MIGTEAGMAELLRVKRLDERLLALRERAKAGRDPTATDETLECLLEHIEREPPARILEIGAGEGLTSCALLLFSAAELTAIEADPLRAARARENFERFGLSERAVLYEGDAGEILPLLGGEYGLIFLDGPKAQYRRYLPDLKRLLRRGGVLFSDDVLLFGWGSGAAPIPSKRRMLAAHIQEYLRLLQADPELSTEILPIGEGLAVSTRL